MFRMICVLVFSVTTWTTFAEPLPSPYQLNVNQIELYSQALEKARAESKMLIVIFGTEWCGYCRSLGTVLETSEVRQTLDPHFVIVHIGLEAKNRAKTVGGVDVFELVNKMASDPISKIPGYPWLAMVNPAIEKSVWIDSTPFEGASPQDARIQHDPKKVVEGLIEIREALKK